MEVMTEQTEEKKAAPSRAALVEEAKKQSAALKTIGKWRRWAMVIAGIGAVLIYGGLTHSPQWVPLTVVGAAVTILGLMAAIACDMGIRNGRKNVEKILDAADRK